MKKILTAAIILTISGEITARLLGFGAPTLYQPSVAGYEITPNQNTRRLTKTSHYNNFGLRGPDILPHPKPGVTRILTIGDSVNNGGSQVNDNETYPYQLETAFKNQGLKDIEVLNASAGGWAIQNEEKWLKEHGTYGSKIIILEINEKDLDQEWVSSEILDKNPSFPSKKPLTGLGEIWNRYILPRITKNNTRDPGSEDGKFKASESPKAIKSVDEIKSFSDKNNAKLIIIYWDPKDISESEEVKQGRTTLFDWAQRNGVAIYRPRIEMANFDPKVMYRDSIHPSALANQRVANFIQERLNTQLMPNIDLKR